MLLVDVKEELKTETVVGKGCAIEGKLKVEGPLRIDGSVTGKIEARDVVVIAAGARVAAEVVAATVIVHGAVEGDVRASLAIELRATALVKGSIAAPTVVVERGAILEGACKMEPEPQLASRQLRS